ncbi:MAG TPA: HAMP domain-containing sensor histidine kinase [Methylomirabilota bacterium]
MARLHSRIYVHFLGVLLVVAVTTGVVFALGAREAFRREMAPRITRHLASLVGERLGDPTALAARLQQIHDDLHLAVRVRDLDGRVVAAAGDELPALTAAEERDVRAGRLVIRPRPMGFAAAPIRDPSSGAVVGVVEGAVPRPMGAPPLWRPMLVVALALLVVAVATRPLAQRISRPLERLTAAARRLGGGDLSARAPADGAHARRHDEITELTRAFNEMAERVERLVRAEKDLLANVSHELRSPLARIRVALALLPRAAGDERLLRDVERDLAELDRLIEDVLTTARLEATGLPARLGPVDARPLLAELAERARHDPLTAAVPVSVENGPAVTLTADEALLRRALWNLVENAAKYGAPPITLSASVDGERVLFTVSDEGPGVAPADRERVFAPFYRADTARTPDPSGEARRGVGLGLTLARRVAEVHGGAIAIGPGAATRGCRVTLTIPRAPVTSSA